MSSCFFAGCTFFVFRTEENEGEPCEKCFILILSFAVSFSNRCVMVFKGEEKHVLAAHDGDDVVLSLPQELSCTDMHYGNDYDTFRYGDGNCRALCKESCGMRAGEQPSM